MTNPAQNTDRELWREREGDYYAPHVFVTESGGIGISVGGLVLVKTLREWHALGRAALKASLPGAALPSESPSKVEVGHDERRDLGPEDDGWPVGTALEAGPSPRTTILSAGEAQRWATYNQLGPVGDGEDWSGAAADTPYGRCKAPHPEAGAHFVCDFASYKPDFDRHVLTAHGTDFRMLEAKVNAQNWYEQYQAWRKRAEEAEAELAGVRGESVPPQ